MDPKRKKIYIILIVVCLLLSAGVLYWSNSGSSTPPHLSGPSSPTNAVPGSAGYSSISSNSPQASGSVETGFKAPAVFPATDKFNTEVLDTDSFKKLKSFNPVSAAGQLGRPNPFNNY
jgi:hypothetical protein